MVRVDRCVMLRNHHQGFHFHEFSFLLLIVIYKKIFFMYLFFLDLAALNQMVYFCRGPLMGGQAVRRAIKRARCE